MKIFRSLIVLAALLLSGLLLAQPKDEPKQERKDAKQEQSSKTESQQKEQQVDVVVTPSRYEKDAGELTRELEVTKKPEMESKGAKTLSEVVADTPGVITTQTGGYGGQTGIFIRGGQSEQVLVLVDGIEVNDPMMLGRSAAAELLSLPGVDRVEILEGPASSLYGSDAEAGVINLITSRPQQGQGLRLAFEGGSFDTYHEQLEAYYSLPNFYIDLAGAEFDTTGISSASSELGNHERDGYHNLGFSLKTGGKPTNWLELEAVGRIIDARTELDTVNLESGLPEDDPDYLVKSRLYLAALRASILTGDWKNKLEFQYAANNRDYKDETDELHPLTSMDGYYDGALSKFIYQADYTPDPANKLVMGAEYQDEMGKSDVEGTSDYGPYEDKFSKKTLATTSGFILWDHHQKTYGFMAGGRGDENEKFGAATTGEFGAYFQPWEPGPKFRAHVGTGFKAPSLYQLYGEVGGFKVGNENLSPETSSSWEAGFDQQLFDKKIILSATYFDTSYRDLIVFDSLTYGYNNVDKARAPGWEAEIKISPTDNLDMKASYCFVDARDAETDEKLIRRWGEKYTWGIDYRPVRQLELYLWGIHRGSTPDQVFALYGEESKHLKPYTLLNFSAKWQVNEQLAADFRVINIFNEEYFEAYGYGVMPLTFYGGLSYNISRSL